MPVFSLTPAQRRALEALEWLHSDEHRRTGRSMVLALGYLRRLIVLPMTGPGLDGWLDGWLDVEDHVGGSGAASSDRRLVQVILGMASQIGFHGLEVHPSRLMIRVQRDAVIPNEVIEALTSFGDTIPDTANFVVAGPRHLTGATAFTAAQDPPPPLLDFLVGPAMGPSWAPFPVQFQAPPPPHGITWSGVHPHDVGGELIEPGGELRVALERWNTPGVGGRVRGRLMKEPPPPPPPVSLWDHLEDD